LFSYSVYFYCFQANTDGPEFSTTYNNTEQKIDVTFTSLEVVGPYNRSKLIYDFRITTMFGSSLLPVVYKRAHVLFTLFVNTIATHIKLKIK
jgi:hypothetical protein